MEGGPGLDSRLDFGLATRVAAGEETRLASYVERLLGPGFALGAVLYFELFSI